LELFFLLLHLVLLIDVEGEEIADCDSSHLSLARALSLSLSFPIIISVATFLRSLSGSRSFISTS
jgi:hypothetical protein